MVGDCPKEVRRAVRAFARAVKAVADLADLPSPDPLTEYHAKEYLEEMETLLVHQLLTAFGSDSDRVELLSAYELEYLAEMVRSVEKEWNED
ncbi:MAG: hypothetical protein IKH49_03285 [Bacteroidales bacterium]|jgi:hypothetical protein|nr:hypothetical protein [Bacteroidales bacterium]